MIIIKFILYILIAFVIISAQSIAQLWELQNPKPTSSQLWDNFFIDSQKGWAVGEAGTIIQTVDGGKNWENVSSYSDYENNMFISSVHFVNEQEGWISGYFPDDINGTHNQSKLLKTTDNGKSWETKLVLYDVDTSYYINATNFIDEDNIICVGGKIINNFVTPLYYRTSDGGLSWTETNSDLIGHRADLFSVHFIDNQNGWVAGTSDLYQGRIIFRTTDGGLSWQKVFEQKEASGYLYDIYFTDSLNGWACGGSSFDGFTYNGVLMKTSDGGNNWTEDLSFPKIVFSEMFFIDESTVVLIGVDNSYVDDGFGNFFQQNNAAIIKTSDGGNTFEKSNILDKNNNDLVIANALQSISFFDSQNGCTFGDRGTILLTSDGGRNWYQQNKSQFLETLTFVDYADSFNGWAAGESSYNIYKTNDGGKNWYSQHSDTSFFYRSITSINEKIGWVAGTIYEPNFINTKAAVLKTTDGGLNWNKDTLELEAENANLMTIFFIDEATGWIAGGHSYFNGNVEEMRPLILKTTDGGSNWNLDTIGTSHLNGLILSLFFIDADNGWACGSQYDILTGYLTGKKIFKTTDGGTTWVNTYLEDSLTVGFLSNIHFANRNNGWAVGQTDTVGVILRTTDSGVSWTEVKVKDIFSKFNNTVFLDDQTGWIAGSGLNPRRSILHTQNGGLDWISMSVTEPYNFYCNISFADEDYGCVVGGNGLVSTYKKVKIVTEAPAHIEYCTGESIQLPFTISDSLSTDMTFVAQISNSDGSFDYSPVIGQSISDKSGYINAKIPDDIEPGEYKLRVWGADNYVDISVAEVPKPKISGPVNACKGTIASYSLDINTGTSVEWSIEGGAIQGTKFGNEVNVLWDTIGYGLLSVVVTKDKQSCQGVSQFRIKVSSDGSTPDLKIEGPDRICYGNTEIQEYKNNDIDVINTWSVSRGKIIGDSVGNTVNIQFEYGIDTVFLHQEVLSGGCINTLYKVVKTDTTNIRRKIIGDDAVCSGTVLEYTALDKGVNTYKWYSDKGTIISDDTSETVRISFNESGVHDLILNVTSILGCTVTNKLSIDVDLNGMQILGDSLVCRDSNVVYTYYANHKGLECLWTVRGGDIMGPDNIDSINVIWRKSILRTVQLEQTVTGGCSNSTTRVIRLKKPELTVSIPEVKVSPAEFYDKTILIPINYLDFSCAEDVQDTGVITIRIKIDRLSFLPIKKENISWMDVDDWRIITITLDAHEIGMTAMYNLEGYILLGDKLESDIIIDYVTTDNTELKITTENGKLILEGIPNIDGYRLLTKSSFQVKLVAPNPSEGDFRLEITSLFNQPVNLAVKDMLGNDIFNRKVELVQGNNSIYIDDLNISSGHYMITIHNKEEMRSIKLLIEK